MLVELRPSPFAKDSPKLARIEAALQSNLLALNAVLGGGDEVHTASGSIGVVALTAFFC